MGIKQKADDARKKAYQKVIATKLLDGIDRLSDRASSKRRWIWELLQNAKDVANGRVKVEILLTKDCVEFRHNGNPFSIENVTYLIEQVSSKERTFDANEAPKTTGKFGTGFMTTHLLSRKVEVSGVLQNEEEDSYSYKHFSVLLDRSATDLDEMIQNVDAAFSIFEEIDNDTLYPKLKNYQPNKKCDTSFRYILDEAGFQVAKAGIQDLQNAIAYALAFIPTIESVTVTDQTQASISRYQYTTVKRTQIGQISIVTIEKNGAESTGDIQTIAYLSNDNQTITIAVEVQNLGENRYSIKKINQETPILFCEFPLIGSEVFPYPVVINSPLFNPTEPRDGIFLNPENQQKTPQNQALLEQATRLYRDFLNQVTSTWQNVHLLGKLKSEAKLPENMDTSWYKDQIYNQIVHILTNALLVDTVSGQRICLKDSLIPSYKFKNDVEKFVALAAALHADCLPQLDHVLDWHEILKSDLGKKFSADIKYSLENLLQKIADEQTLAQLAKRISKTDSDTLDWINQVIAFTSRNSEDLFSQYSIIPNQYNEFKKKQELHQDLAIPEALKDVLQILAIDWRTILAHKGLTYQLSKTLDINQAVDDINKIIRSKKHSSLRRAVYTLVSCFPTDARFEQNTQLVSKRDTLWHFARDLDRDAVPEKIYLESWTSQLWQEADLWLMETFVDDIERLTNVAALSKKLNGTLRENGITWLNRFLAFLTKENQSKIYIEKGIFPNQEEKGIFWKKEDLYIDINIPDELKDVLDALGLPSREKLLDAGIQGFENHPRKITVKKVSDEIKKRLQEAKGNKEDLTEYWSFSVPVSNLVSYFRDSEPNNSNKIAIWEFANKFYPSQIPNKKLLPNLQDFSWDACNEWILNSIAKDINSFETLENLVNYFNFEQNIAIEWLDNFSYFVATQDAEILNLYAILPNQLGRLMHKKDLKQDGGIPEELKEILELLTSDYWNNFLLDRNLPKAASLFDRNEIKTIEDIAKEIDDAIKQWELDDKTGDSQFTKVITGMIEWANTQEDKEVKRLFTYFYQNKAQLFLKTLDDNEVSSSIFTILNHQEKLAVLTDLAQNPDISEQDLQAFAQNSAQFKAFQELLQQIPDGELQTLNVLTQDVSLEKITELVENKEKLDILKHLQDSAEAGDMSALIWALEELGIYDAVANLFRTTTNNEVTRAVSKTVVLQLSERTIYKQDIADIGREGEAFLYQKLVDKFGENSVTWLNKDGESQSPYDFVVENAGLEYLYIDAKTTVTEEGNADRIPFYVGSSEWDFSEKNERYYLARVFSIRTTTPTVKFLKFVRLLNS
ncbi:MAG: hypothetical protein Fur0025_23670 [Oscillatoriaceae cyanobacterium]